MDIPRWEAERNYIFPIQLNLRHGVDPIHSPIIPEMKIVNYTNPRKVPCPHQEDFIDRETLRLSRELGLDEKLPPGFSAMAKESLFLRFEHQSWKRLEEKKTRDGYANATFTPFPKLPPELKSNIWELAVAPELRRPRIHTIALSLPPNSPRLARRLPSISEARVPNLLQPRT